MKARKEFGKRKETTQWLANDLKVKGEERKMKMVKKISLGVMVVTLVGAPAYAQMGNPSNPEAPITVTDGNQPELTIVGKIKELDLANGSMTLQDGTQFNLPPSFQYTSFPAVGEEVEVTFDVHGGQKVVRFIDQNDTGNSGHGE